MTFGVTICLGPGLDLNSRLADDLQSRCERDQASIIHTRDDLHHLLPIPSLNSLYLTSSAASPTIFYQGPEDENARRISHQERE